MRALVWKELAEQGKWAVLWLAGLTLALAFILPPRGAQGDALWTICVPAVQVLIACAAALGAALLGLLQTLPEMRRERWALLAHRPISLTRIFLAKVAAGLLLYFAALGLPVLGAAVWAATPGRVGAPFDWRMALPAAADILGGVVFYFAGMLTGIRPARWYGSRALGLLAAVPCALALLAVAEFWQAVLVTVPAAAVMGVAAWGSFVTAGQYRPMPRVAKVALGLCLLAGAGVAAGAVLGAVMELSSRPTVSFVQYQLDEEGRILRVMYRDGRLMAVTDPQGTVLEACRDPLVLDRLRPLRQGYALSEWSGRLAGAGVGYRDPMRFFTWFGAHGGERWFYVHADGRLHAYSELTRRLLGSIGPDGFALPGAGRARFTSPLPLAQSSVGPWAAMVADAEVYRVDLHSRQVRLLYSAGPAGAIRGAGCLFVGGEPEPMLVLGTDHGITLLTQDGEVLLRVAYHYDTGVYPNVALTVLPGRRGYIIWYQPPLEARCRPVLPPTEHIVRLTAGGEEVSREVLPPLPPPRPGRRWLELLPALAVPVVAVAAVVAYAALVTALLGAAHPAGLAAMWAGLHAAQGPIVFGGAALLLLMAGLSAALGVVVARRQAFSPRATRATAVACFLLGPVMLLALLALRDWVPRVPCPGCGRPRIVERDACEHCGAPFAPPPRDGTEVFET